VRIRSDVKFYNTTGYETQGLKDLLYRVCSVMTTRFQQPMHSGHYRFDADWQSISVSEVVFVQQRGKSFRSKVEAYTVREEGSIRLGKKLYVFVPKLHNATEDVYFNLTHAISLKDPMPESLFIDIASRISAALSFRYARKGGQPYIPGVPSGQFPDICKNEIMPHVKVVTRKRDDKCQNRREKALLSLYRAEKASRKADALAKAVRKREEQNTKDRKAMEGRKKSQELNQAVYEKYKKYLEAE